MKLLIIRHADAGDPDAWERAGKPDLERPLSEKGRKQFKKHTPPITYIPLEQAH